MKSRHNLVTYAVVSGHFVLGRFQIRMSVILSEVFSNYFIINTK
jgi:hypothetical protein